jgi:superfamily I DNA/RNA helicase
MNKVPFGTGSINLGNTPSSQSMSRFVFAMAEYGGSHYHPSERIRTPARRTPSPQVLRHLALFPARSSLYSVEIVGNQGKSPDQISLMTLHSSKELEFEAVIMIGLEAGAFPSSQARTEEQLEEAGRLFYVGVTRAKSMAHLMHESNGSPFITAIRGARESAN